MVVLRKSSVIDDIINESKIFAVAIRDIQNLSSDTNSDAIKLLFESKSTVTLNDYILVFEDGKIELIKVNEALIINKQYEYYVFRCFQHDLSNLF